MKMCNLNDRAGFGLYYSEALALKSRATFDVCYPVPPGKQERSQSSLYEELGLPLRVVRSSWGACNGAVAVLTGWRQETVDGYRLGLDPRKFYVQMQAPFWEHLRYASGMRSRFGFKERQDHLDLVAGGMPFAIMMQHDRNEIAWTRRAEDLGEPRGICQVTPQSFFHSPGLVDVDGHTYAELGEEIVFDDLAAWVAKQTADAPARFYGETLPEVDLAPAEVEAALRQHRIADPNRPVYLYLMRCEDTAGVPLLKLGLASNPAARRDGLQTGCPFAMEVVARTACTMPAGRAVGYEAQAHELLDGLQSGGGSEWFVDCEDLARKALAQIDLVWAVERKAA